jgi:hypothetical protein
MRVPIFQEPGLTQFLVDLIAERDRFALDRLSRITANHSVLLQSPGGKVYEVKVNDAGVISATLVAG